MVFLLRLYLVSLISTLLGEGGGGGGGLGVVTSRLVYSQQFDSNRYFVFVMK